MHVLLLGTLVVIASVGWLMIASQGLSAQYYDSHGQLMIVLHKPWIFIAALLRSLLRRSGTYFSQMMGSYMGAFLVKNDMVLIYGVTAAVALISLIRFMQNLHKERSKTEKIGSGNAKKLSSENDSKAPGDSADSGYSERSGLTVGDAASAVPTCTCRTDQQQDEVPTAETPKSDHGLGLKGRLNLLITSGITVLLIFLSEYILWTNYLGRYVDGIQGRYFIPIIPLMLTALFGMQDNDLEKERLQYSLLLGLNLCVALNAFVSWLYLTGSTVAY